MLQADISNFYGSVYTHAVAWALHGKAYAKRHMRNPTLLGNKMDKLFRGLQDGQSIGIPVGPDASLLFAEIISSAVDKLVFTSRVKESLRYIDDYESVFALEEDAIRFRSSLQVALAQYRLTLNPLKTKIYRLPTAIDEGWTRALRRIISGKTILTSALIIDYFDCTFRIAELHPSDGILKFAIGKLATKLFSEDASDLTDDLLIQACRVEAGCLPFAAAILLRRSGSTSLRKDKLRHCLSAIIIDHAPQRHSSEVAWALWLMAGLRLQVDADMVRLVLDMEDSVCALLLIEMSRRDLLARPNALNTLKKLLSADDLYDSRWMLAYESIKSGWFGPSPSRNYVALDLHFNFLSQQNVRFFNSSLIGAIPHGLLPMTESPEESDPFEENEPEIEDSTPRYSEGDFWDEWEEWEDDPELPTSE